MGQHLKGKVGIRIYKRTLFLQMGIGIESDTGIKRIWDRLQ
jgi:hypothetical protein